MRITCPRCSALYEVPDSVMPPGGRDVQCSDCGHSWYQLVSKPAPRLSPDSAAEDSGGEAPAASGESDAEERLRRLRDALDGHKARSGRRDGTRALNLATPTGVPPNTLAEEPETEEPETDAPRRTEPAQAAGGSPEHSAAPGGQSEAEDADSAPPDPDDAEDASPNAPPKRGLDPEVAAVLRAEAEFERNARLHGPVQALEMQPELGLAAPAPRPRRSADSVRDRLALLQEAERSGAAAPLSAGEETFPDPAALGLRSPAKPAAFDAGPASDPAPPPRPPALRPGPGLPVRAEPRQLAVLDSAQARKDFRLGFFLSLSICLAAPALYLAAPALADLVPGQSTVFDEIAQTGARVHVALAGALQDWLTRFGDWMSAVTAAAA